MANHIFYLKNPNSQMKTVYVILLSLTFLSSAQVQGPIIMDIGSSMKHMKLLSNGNGLALTFNSPLVEYEASLTISREVPY